MDSLRPLSAQEIEQVAGGVVPDDIGPTCPNPFPDRDPDPDFGMSVF